jgi:DNA polymerase (family 10)
MMRRNAEVADYLRLLHDFLVVGGHHPTYAKPYARIANLIANHEVDVEILAKERRLKRISRLGWMMEKTIIEYLKTGTSSKFEGYAKQTPRTILELLEIPGVGVKTAAILFQSFGISSLAALRTALQEGWLQDLGVFSPKLIERMKDYADDF